MQLALDAAAGRAGTAGRAAAGGAKRGRQPNTVRVVDNSGRYKEQSLKLRKGADGRLLLPFMDTSRETDFACPFVFPERRAQDGARGAAPSRAGNNIGRRLKVNGGGVCEVCSVRYRSYAKHVNGISHILRKRKDANNRELVGIIESLPRCARGPEPSPEQLRAAAASVELDDEMLVRCDVR